MQAWPPILLVENLRSIVSFHFFLCMINILVGFWEKVLLETAVLLRKIRFFSYFF